MFKGITYQTMDCKGRVILPQKFRDALGESFCITYGFPNDLGKKYRCLQIMSNEEFEKLIEQIRALPAKSSLALEYNILAPAADVSPNSQGRIQVPQALRLGASLEKELVVLGMYNRIEIWDKDLYEEFREKSMEVSCADAMELLRF